VDAGRQDFSPFYSEATTAKLFRRPRWFPGKNSMTKITEFGAVALEHM
jgi:hypothetical protein